MTTNIVVSVVFISMQYDAAHFVRGYEINAKSRTGVQFDLFVCLFF